ncbi:hypothetical protein [Oceanobacillus chungangensis]|nr:hypothetical protein [Oceanobacillus chungangensis]
MRNAISAGARENQHEKIFISRSARKSAGERLYQQEREKISRRKSISARA